MSRLCFQENRKPTNSPSANRYSIVLSRQSAIKKAFWKPTRLSISLLLIILSRWAWQPRLTSSLSFKTLMVAQIMLHLQKKLSTLMIILIIWHVSILTRLRQVNWLCWNALVFSSNYKLRANHYHQQLLARKKENKKVKPSSLSKQQQVSKHCSTRQSLRLSGTQWSVILFCQRSPIWSKCAKKSTI